MYSHFSHKRVSLLLNAPHPDNIALTNGVYKSEFGNFQTLRSFFSNVPKKLINEQDTDKVSNFEQ